jgi:hypothetical protein
MMHVYVAFFLDRASKIVIKYIVVYTWKKKKILDIIKDTYACVPNLELQLKDDVSGDLSISSLVPCIVYYET